MVQFVVKENLKKVDEEGRETFSWHRYCKIDFPRKFKSSSFKSGCTSWYTL